VKFEKQDLQFILKNDRDLVGVIIGLVLRAAIPIHGTLTSTIEELTLASITRSTTATR
jgi:hypothetical protein